MKIDLSQFRQTFMQESAEHVESMEAGLLALRSAPDDVETLNAIFRSAHSIKGGAGSFGLTHLVRFTHVLESLLDRLRSLEIPATAEVISLLLQSVDVLHAMLSSEEGEMPDRAAQLAEQIESLSATHAPAKEPIGQKVSESGQAGPGEAPLDDGQLPGRELNFYRVEFRPHREMFSSGTNPIMLLRNLAALGAVSVCQLHAEELPPLAELDPDQCHLSWTIELASSCAEAELREVFEFVEHLAEITIRSVDQPAQPEKGLALHRPAVQGTILEAVSPAVPDIAESVERRKLEARRKAEERRAVKKPAAAAESSSIRVATEKVDRLIDLVGELVIAQVMTAQMVEDFEPACLPKLRDAVAAMERSTRELHERVMSVRMMAVGTLFQRYVRVVYDIAQSTGKQIRLETDGEETEIDKSMLELLGDPLTHLIRNAADHGIESAAVRLAANKPAEGLIHMRAFHRAGRIVIEISDDGAGIDIIRVRAKAVERGLIKEEADLSDDQIRMLIFAPGFSTREEVSDLSGRGVGMDVVKRNVQQLSGTVALTSTLGSGSTVSIELPLTLAILEGLMIRVGDRTLVLPLLAVVEAVPCMGKIVRVAEQAEVIVIRGESIPVLRLCRFLEARPGAPHGAELAADRYTDRGVEPDAASSRGAETAEEQRLVVVVEAGRKKIGLMVDELLGQQQVVVKSLEKNLHKVEGLMGATILGDGRVAPILDVTALSELNLFAVGHSSGKRRPGGASAVSVQTALSAPVAKGTSARELV
ncbi:MAG: chemotaxis protein CheA [Acidobacteriaceae bacterium]|jgi:two-component system chemotaxis sensor kinase CheA